MTEHREVRGDSTSAPGMDHMITPTVTDDMVRAGAEVRLRQYESEYNADHLSWKDFAQEARDVLEAALSTQRCGETTEADRYLGEQGVLSCVKWVNHRGAHRSAEGAVW